MDADRLRDILEAIDAIVFEVDWDEVWMVVARDLKGLRSAIVTVLEAEGWAP